MNKTKIEYLDFTSNPIVGCDMTLPCAERCWARTMAFRLRCAGVPAYQQVIDKEGRWTGKTAFVESELQALLRRRKPATVGLSFMGDVFHESVPDAWLDQMLAVVALTPHLRYILPTKRAKRMREYLLNLERVAADWQKRLDEKGTKREGGKPFNASSVLNIKWLHAGAGRAFPDSPWPLLNLALMLSASNQQELDDRAGDFFETPAALHILSLEPMLGEVDIAGWLSGHGKPEWDAGGDIHRPFYGKLPKWVIVGGESGPGARPMPPEWLRVIRDQCIAAGIPYFHKQNGEWATTPTEIVTIRTKYEDVPVGDGTHHRMFPVGKRAAGRLLDGKMWDQMPEGWR